MANFCKPSRAEQDLKWAKIWFKQFTTFHRRSGKQNGDFSRNWDFSPDDVIAFLRSKRDDGVPAWKRLKALEGLLAYRRFIQERPIDPFAPIREKMKEIILTERMRDGGYDNIEEAVGKINPRESDAIQEFRRAIRKEGLALSTERAYVSKVKAFMEGRGLTCLADFDRVTGDHVEAHLTDLAVDGNVAPTTQNTAFHGLLKFFTVVLKRDMGQIEAIRATKGKQIPTVMSTNEVLSVFAGLLGVYLLIAKLLYGCGMRIGEALRLRVKDIDFDNRLIEIHQSKGNKSRLVPLPENLVEPLQRFVRSREVLARARPGRWIRIGVVTVCIGEEISVGSP